MTAKLETYSDEILFGSLNNNFVDLATKSISLAILYLFKIII